MPFAASWMDLRDYHCKWSQSQKDKCHLSVEYKKWYKWTYLQNKNRLIYIENNLTVTRGEAGEGQVSLGLTDIQYYT